MRFKRTALFTLGLLYFAMVTPSVRAEDNVKDILLFILWCRSENGKLNQTYDFCTLPPEGPNV